MVHVYPFALQHQTGPAIAEVPPVCRDLAHALSDLLICLLLLAPHRLRVDPDQAADPGLRDLMAIQYVQSCGPAFSRNPSAVFQQVLQDGIIEHLASRTRDPNNPVNLREIANRMRTMSRSIVQ